MNFILKSPLDMHLHLRDTDMLKIVAPLSSQTFSGGLVMPNLVPPVTTVEALLEYKNRIISAINGNVFTPYMTLFFQNYTYDFLKNAKEHITSIKLYPAGITTNSDNGVSSFDLDALKPTLDAMAELGIVLSIHGETNDFVMDREKNFMKIYEALAQNFPTLKIVMEHITTKEAVETLEKYENLYATITLHHLLITLDDVAGGMLRPHLFCKPIAKRDEDRAALLKVALDGHPKVMFGSDSAPHPQHAKESCGCAAGVFTAPIALQKLVELFEEHGKLGNLQKFVSNNAQEIYGIKPIEKEIHFKKENYLVPEKYGNVVPMYSGEYIKWSID